MDRYRLVSVLSDPQTASPSPRLVEDFDQTLVRLAEAPAFSKYTHQSQLLVRTAKLLKAPGGVAVLADRADGFDAAGVFAGTDWDMPAGLQPALVGPTLRFNADAWVAVTGAVIPVTLDGTPLPMNQAVPFNVDH